MPGTICDHSALPLCSAQAVPPKLPSCAICSAPFLPASPGGVDTLPNLYFISTKYLLQNTHAGQCIHKCTKAAGITPCATGRAPTCLPRLTLGQPSTCLSQLWEDTKPHRLLPSWGKQHRSGSYVHGVPVAQPSAVPTAPGVHLSSGCQGQVVVTVRMGSDFDNVSGDKTLDELRGLKGEKQEDD